MVLKKESVLEAEEVTPLPLEGAFLPSESAHFFFLFLITA